MTRKSKIISSSILSDDDLEQAVETYAVTSHNLAEIEAVMSQEIDAVRSRYVAEITRLKASMEATLDDVASWASLHPECFRSRKSIDLVHGTIGYRTSTPRCTLRRGTDEHALATTMRDDPEASRYVRIALEIDRQGIIARTSMDADAAQMLADRYGIRVTQSERFYIDPKGEEVTS